MFIYTYTHTSIPLDDGRRVSIMPTKQPLAIAEEYPIIQDIFSDEYLEDPSMFKGESKSKIFIYTHKHLFINVYTCIYVHIYA
jgi:hypothetical protein